MNNNLNTLSHATRARASRSARIAMKSFRVQPADAIGGALGDAVGDATGAIADATGAISTAMHAWTPEAPGTMCRP